MNLSADQYHADELGHGDRASLSSSVATILCQQSPAHARAAHPKLSPQLVREEEHHFDLGTAVHDALLQGIDNVAVVEFDSWRSKAAQEQREIARDAGQIPLLEKHYAELKAMVAAAREQLEALDIDPRPFTDGAAEQTLVWEEDGVLCRARLDWLHESHVAIDDFKSTARSAHPDKFERSLYDHGYDVQAVMYRRAVRAVFGVDAEYRWVVQETRPPYALAVVAPGPDVLELGERKLKYALKVWRECLASGEWPAYPRRVCYVELPGWEDARWLAKEQREGLAA